MAGMADALQMGKSGLKKRVSIGGNVPPPPPYPPPTVPPPPSFPPPGIAGVTCTHPSSQPLPPPVESPLAPPKENSGKTKDLKANFKNAKKDKKKEEFEAVRKLFPPGTLGPEMDLILKRLIKAERTAKNLEKQLVDNGISIAEDIPYDECMEQITYIAKRMAEIGSSGVVHPDKAVQKRLRKEYYVLEKSMEKYNAALLMTDEYAEEQRLKEQQWQDENRADNNAARQKLWRHMDVQIKNMSEEKLKNKVTPNGKKLPTNILRRFKRTNVLQLLRTNPEDITRVHPSFLDNLRVTGMTLTERRAIHVHLADLAVEWKKKEKEPMTEKKMNWFNNLLKKFKSDLMIYKSHVEQYGPPGNHKGCPLIGRQCPLKADTFPSYDKDYGYPPDPIYPQSNVVKSEVDNQGAKKAREKAALAKAKEANRRAEDLKKHYKNFKNKIKEISAAGGACGDMEETMDILQEKHKLWIEAILKGEKKLFPNKQMDDFCKTVSILKLEIIKYSKRGGVPLSKRDRDDPDTRSSIEIVICCELISATDDTLIGITDFVTHLDLKNKTLDKSMEALRKDMGNLSVRNEKTLEAMDGDRPKVSKKMEAII
uniref:Uncharacterized protein n=1 Tax=Corethron hystrix TaxID=216773 RepID=A0A7S1BT04_9STRA